MAQIAAGLSYGFATGGDTQRPSTVLAGSTNIDSDLHSTWRGADEPPPAKRARRSAPSDSMPRSSEMSSSRVAGQPAGPARTANKHLTELDLRDVQLSEVEDFGIRALSAMLQTNTVLSTIDLRMHQLGDLPGQLIIQALPPLGTASAIKYVHLSERMKKGDADAFSILSRSFPSR